MEYFIMFSFYESNNFPTYALLLPTKILKTNGGPPNAVLLYSAKKEKKSWNNMASRESVGRWDNGSVAASDLAAAASQDQIPLLRAHFISLSISFVNLDFYLFVRMFVFFRLAK